MKSQSTKKATFKKIGFGLLALIFVLIILAAGSVWQEMVRHDTESNAVSIINQVHNAQNKYYSAYRGKFATNFDELIKFGFLDEKLSGEKPIVDGYVFEMKVKESIGIKPAFYSLNADPQQSKNLFSNLVRHFYYDSTLAATRSTDENRQAKANDPTI